MKRMLLVTLCLVGLGCGVETADTDAQEKKGTVTELGGLKAHTPADWVKVTPPPLFKRTRKYQFRIPKVKGNAKNGEMRITYFGENGAGETKAVVERWKNMFRAPKGKKIDDVAKVEKFKAGKAKVTMVDIQGTYLYKFPPFAPNAKITPLPNYRMFAAIFSTEKGPYYIVATGPAKTMAENKKGFEKWLKSFK